MDNYKLEQENLRYVEKKIKLCLSIYSLLKSVCKNNYDNEIYAFDLIPQFLIQVFSLDFLSIKANHF